MAKVFYKDDKAYVHTGINRVPKAGDVYLYNNKPTVGGGNATYPYAILRRVEPSDIIYDIVESKQKEETYMKISKIKTVVTTTLDGVDIAVLPDESLISNIIKIEDEIVRLSEIKVDSDAIKSRIQLHTEVCDKLAEILDERNSNEQ